LPEDLLHDCDLDAVVVEQTRAKLAELVQTAHRSCS
jgi:hypothetical protein